MQATYAAFLRGINVGGKNRLPMRDLAGIFEAAGASDVTTFIQSGNVVFRAPERSIGALPKRAGDAVFERFGFRPPMVIRSAAHVAEIVANNPFLATQTETKFLHVMFLGTAPAAAAIAALDPQRSPPDAFAIRGSDIYLFMPNGGADSKLTTAYFDAKLATTSTIRNWTTVVKIAALLGVR